MYSVRGQKMFDYLSWYYGNSRIMQSVLDSQGVEIDAARAALESSLDQFYAKTVDWGIVQWEKELAITPPANAQLELRQALVKAKLLSAEIMTPQRIRSIANCFVPGKDTQITEHHADYSFDIYLPSFVPYELAQSMYKAIYEIKPAHLSVTYHMLRKRDMKLFCGSTGVVGTKVVIKPVLKYQPRIDSSYWVGNIKYITRKIKVLPNTFKLTIDNQFYYCDTVKHLAQKTTVLIRPPKIAIDSSKNMFGTAISTGKKVTINLRG